MKISFKLFGRLCGLLTYCAKLPKEWTAGMTNRVGDTQFHVLFMDYDLIREDLLINELLNLQEIFELGNFYLFRTRLAGYRDLLIEDGENVQVEKDAIPVGGYHAICLDEFFAREVIGILRSSHCDYAFITAPSYNPEKDWVLRAWEKGNREKPEYMATLESPYEGKNGRLQSLLHARYIDSVYGLEIEKNLKNSDGIEEGNILQFYDTAKRVKRR